MLLAGDLSSQGLPRPGCFTCFSFEYSLFLVDVLCELWAERVEHATGVGREVGVVVPKRSNSAKVSQGVKNKFSDILHM